MKLTAALLASAALSVATLSASATPVDPILNDYTIKVGNTVLSDANVSYNPLLGNFTFSDHTSTFTFVEVNAAPLVSALSITRTCLTLDSFGYGCGTEAVSVTDASLLDGTIQAAVLVGATLSVGADANVGNLVFAKSNLGLAAETAIVGAPASTGSTGSTSPVPEPGSLGLMATGLLGAAGALRRKFLA